MKRIAVVGALAAVVLAAAAPASAQASTGVLSNAFATPDWKYARFSVSASATPCVGGYCSYFPTVTAVPSLPAYSFCREVVLDSDRNTQTAWTGSTYSANATIAADVPKAAILNGVYGQRLCLSLVGNREVKDVICEARQKIWEEFYGETFPCPPIKQLFEEPVTSAVLTVEPPPAPPSPPASSPAPASPPEGARQECPKGKRLVKRNGKLRCVPRRCPKSTHRVKRKGKVRCVKVRRGKGSR